MIVFAPLSSKLVARFGTKRVVTAGMLLFAAGLAVAATVTAEHAATAGSASRCVLMGAGMGLAGAPATESIMGSLPPERANIGSAVNDTTRELGGALGVAIVGQHHVVALRDAARREPDVPARRAAAASRSAPPSRLGAGRRRRGARGVRPRDVAGVDRRRARGRARRLHRLALSPGSLSVARTTARPARNGRWRR